MRKGRKTNLSNSFPFMFGNFFQNIATHYSIVSPGTTHCTQGAVSTKMYALLLAEIPQLFMLPNRVHLHLNFNQWINTVSHSFPLELARCLDQFIAKKNINFLCRTIWHKPSKFKWSKISGHNQNQTNHVWSKIYIPGVDFHPSVGINPNRSISLTLICNLI